MYSSISSIFFSLKICQIELFLFIKKMKYKNMIDLIRNEYEYEYELDDVNTTNINEITETNLFIFFYIICF